MYNNKATKNAKTSNNKKMTTLNRKTIPYQAHHNSANVLQLETKKVNSISKEANMHKSKQRQLVTKQTYIRAKGTKTLPAGCFFVGTFNNHQAEEN